MAPRVKTLCVDSPNILDLKTFLDNAVTQLPDLEVLEVGNFEALPTIEPDKMVC